MNAARTHFTRPIDWSCAKGDGLGCLVRHVTSFVAGIRGPRQEGVSRKQILKWFYGTPEDFVEKAILEACTQCKIRCVMRSLGSNSRANGAHLYIVDEPTADAGGTGNGGACYCNIVAAASRPCGSCRAGFGGRAKMAGMPTRKPNPIQLVPAASGFFRIVRPGAYYVARLTGDVYQGEWAPEGEPIAHRPAEALFTEREGRLLLPFLRVRATGGRQGGEPTTTDGKLVARACKRLGLTAAGLAERIGAHESVLSRARNGELPAKHRDAIRALLRGKE